MPVVLWFVRPIPYGQAGPEPGFDVQRKMTEIEDDEWSARQSGDNVMVPWKLVFTDTPNQVLSTW